MVAFNPRLSAPLMLPTGATIDSGLVQVILNGRVIGASRAAATCRRCGTRATPQVTTVSEVLRDMGKDVRAVSVPVRSGGQKGNVVVVASMEQFDHTVADVQALKRSARRNCSRWWG